jgi:4-oxalocrotonate tautomerase
MAFVNVKVIEGVLSAAQKEDVVKKITNAMVSVGGEHVRPITWVVVEEVKSGDWGIGGKTFTTGDLKALGDFKALAAEKV